MTFTLRIHAHLAELGATPRHAELVLRAWLAGERLECALRSRHCSFSPAVAREFDALERELDLLARPVAEHPGADGSARLLHELADGRTVESVHLLRDGVCVSSQVGCAVGCTFCMTGREGLVRNLTADEILAQVVHARRRRRVRRVVFMGMGEPSHNLANVLGAIDALGGAGGFGHKELVFSTVGDKKLFDKLLARATKPAIALSLHTTRDEVRAELLPRAPRIAVAELVALAEHYARTSGHPIQVQWTLLAGVNDGDDELGALVDLFRGKHAIVNFIPFNTVEGAPFARPSAERAHAMAKHLSERGVLSKVRLSAGQDVDGACGQLRARTPARN
ncbi:MAG: RNA methyltransferase [Planctomycetes bacterium]|nr:RNA methyltransferase [Planctomycetota bacterium]